MNRVGFDPMAPHANPADYDYYLPGFFVRKNSPHRSRNPPYVMKTAHTLGSMGLSKGFIESMTREGIKVSHVMDVSGSAIRF